MDRLIGIVVLLLVAAVALPAIAAVAQSAIPPLIALLFLLGIVRMAWPSRRR